MQRRSYIGPLERKGNRIGKLFLAPTFVVLLLIIAYPTLYTIAMSFFRWRPTELATPFVGMKNYVDVVGDKRFPVSLMNTLLYAFGGAFFKVVIGLGLALLLNQDIKGRGLFRTLLMLPWIIPVSASITSWRWMLDGMYGIINTVLMNLQWIDARAHQLPGYPGGGYGQRDDGGYLVGLSTDDADVAGRAAGHHQGAV